MSHNLEKEIDQIIVSKVEDLNRPDLLRKPLVGFSSAHDPRYPKLKQIIGPWHLNPVEILPDAESVISYFVPFTKPVVGEPKKVIDGSPLWGEAYVVINSYFAEISETIASYLISLGYSATAIPATHTYDPKTIECKWSHRSAAHAAGLGSFGANRMLITAKGSGGRFCTVITSAKLKANETQAQNRCLNAKNGSCGKCFEICPVRALQPGLFEKFVCQSVTDRNRELNKDIPILGEADTCGKCISVCPIAYIP